MNELESLGLSDLGTRAQKNAGEPQAGAVSSPLPVGAASQTPAATVQGEAPRTRPIPPAGHALTTAAAVAKAQPSSGLQRAVRALRMALPYVHRILPLLDGNIATAVSNVLSPQQPQHPPAPPVDLEPVEHALDELKTHHRELRIQVMEQNSSLKRVEDQLEMVREATDRNTLEQQELLEDLKTVGNKVNVFALVALGLLAISILLNLILFLHIQRVLP